MKLETILVGVDFSNESRLAVEQAAGLARQHDAKLVLLHAGPVPDVPLPEVPEEAQPALTEYQRYLKERFDVDHEHLVEMRERIAGNDVRTSHMLINGFPDEGICQAAEELDAELVVVGSHGRTGLDRLLLGSVAEKVVRACQRSVLVARPGPTTSGYHKILVATDFTESAERALDAAMTMAAPEAQIDLLHCWQLPPVSSAYGPTPRVAMELAGPLADYSRQLGADLLARYGRPGVSLKFQLMEAAPTQGLLERIDEEGDYSLVVTGSHGRRGIRRLLLGSVAEAMVRHAPTSVLVVHEMPEHAWEAK